MDALRWLGFAAGLVVAIGTVISVMKTLIVPRRGWSLLPAFIGRNGFRLFHGIAVRMRSYDLADRFLGFLAPTVIIGMLVSFLASFVIGFGLMLLPFADLSIGEALRESGSSVFTLGFVATAEAVPTALDVLAGATGMIFVALTIGYLPAIYAEVKKRETLVKQLEGWTGVPSWGPEVLSRFAIAGAIDNLPRLYSDWDRWAASVADTHMKYPVLTHFRLPRAKNHWVIALLAILDAAALDLALRPTTGHANARLLLSQGGNCLRAVTYPMRRVEPDNSEPGIDEADFRKGVDRMFAAGFPAEVGADEAWATFAGLRSQYAPWIYLLAYWTVAAPAPWSGDRAGFVDLVAWPDAPDKWSIS
ncbi:MAG: hypothetical protein GY720_19400 [bacterium]|nr:hypothetical protein [bacterium]